jgi:D-amino-acid dehydrogenase
LITPTPASSWSIGRAASFDAARRLLDYQRSLGCEQEALDTMHACIKKEPALVHLAGQLRGGIFTGSEDSGDCYQFCVGMMRLLRRRGVAFRFGTTVTRLRRTSGRQVTACAGDEDLDADHIVIATGASSVPLLGTLGIRVPLYPLKGYSLTAPLDAGAIAPRISITDYERKMVYARLGDRLRIAGMADITGRRADVDPRRVATLARRRPRRCSRALPTSTRPLYGADFVPRPRRAFRSSTGRRSRTFG